MLIIPLSHPCIKTSHSKRLVYAIHKTSNCISFEIIYMQIIQPQLFCGLQYANLPEFCTFLRPPRFRPIFRKLYPPPSSSGGGSGGDV